MSRLRSRNVRMKIQSAAKWGRDTESLNSSNDVVYQQPPQNNNTSTTADSGIEELTPLRIKSKLPLYHSSAKTKLFKTNWKSADEDVGNPPSTEDALFKFTANVIPESDRTSNSDVSSVDTLCVLEDIQGIPIIDEDVDKSELTSADSWNSWTAPYNQSSTELVRTEYERMMRVLQCLEAIPLYYDRDEYRLWIKTFPCLSLSEKDKSSSMPPAHQQHKLNSVNSNSKIPTYLPPSPQQSTNFKTFSITNEQPINNSITTGTNVDLKEFPPTSPKHSSVTTFSNKKELAINNTINPGTLPEHLEQSFLQLAPLNVGQRHLTGKAQRSHTKLNTNRDRTFEWIKDMQNANHSRSMGNVSTTGRQRTSAKKINSSPSCSHSDFIVLPPIEGRDKRSISATELATTTTRRLSSYKLQQRVFPLYESETELEGEIKKKSEEMNIKKVGKWSALKSRLPKSKVNQYYQ